MKKEMREVFVANDGTEFDSEEACLKHETLCRLESFFNNYGFSQMYPSDVVSTIVENFDQFYSIIDDLALHQAKGV